MRPIQDESFKNAFNLSVSSSVYYVRSQKSNLLLVLDHFFIAIKNKKQNRHYISIDPSQSVISLYSLHCNLQNSNASKKLFCDWVENLSNSKQDYYKLYFGKAESRFSPVDTKIPHAVLPQREDNIEPVRIIAGNRYIGWDMTSKIDLIMYRYKSKSDDDYIVSIKKRDCLDSLYDNSEQLRNALYYSNISSITFLVSGSSFDDEIETTGTPYSYHVLHVIRNYKEIKRFGICFVIHEPIMRPALYKALFELLGFIDADNYRYTSTDKYSIAQEMSGITRLGDIIHGEIFYSYTISNKNTTRLINKRDLYIFTEIVTFKHNGDTVIIISSVLYKKLFYKIFNNHTSSNSILLEKFKNFLVTAILDKNTKVLHNRNERFLFII